MAGCVLGGGTAVNAGLWWKVFTPAFLFSEYPKSANFSDHSQIPPTGTRISPRGGTPPMSPTPRAASSHASPAPGTHPWTASCTSRRATTFSRAASTPRGGNMSCPTTHRTKRTTLLATPSSCLPVGSAAGRWRRTWRPPPRAHALQCG